MPVRPLRDELRRIDDLRNVGSLVLTWRQPRRHDRPGGVDRRTRSPTSPPSSSWVRPIARFAILGHEAAHRLLFTDKRLNDLVGRWFVAYPGFVPFEGYRRSHFAHHKDEFGPDEPDLNLYNGYPITSASFWRKMRRDAFGKSGWKNLKGLLMALTSKTARPFARADRARAGRDPGVVHRGRPARALRAALVAPLDDRVAGHEPPARHRRARRNDALEGPSAHHPPRRAVVGGSSDPGPVQHGLAPRTSRRHGGAVAQPAEAARRTRGGRLGDAEYTYPSYRALWKALRSG